MGKNKNAIFAASVAMILSLAGSAGGGIVYSYAMNQTSFTNVVPGQTVTIDIYLTEALTNGSTSILAPSAENGLEGAGFQLAEVSNALISPTKITSIAFNNDAASNQFNGGPFNFSSVTPTLAQVSESNFESASGTGVELGNNPPLAVASGVSTPANDVFLGTVTFTVGNSPGITLFNLEKGQGEFAGDTDTNVNTFDLDQNGSTAGFFGANNGREPSQSYTGVGNTLTAISIGVVPEPASVSFITIVSAIGLLNRRRRGRVGRPMLEVSERFQPFFKLIQEAGFFPEMFMEKTRNVVLVSCIAVILTLSGFARATVVYKYTANQTSFIGIFTSLPARGSPSTFI